MKKKAQVYRCAESVAKMLELEELHTLRLKLKQEEWTQLLTIVRRPGRGQRCCCLDASLTCSLLRGHTEVGKQQLPWRVGGSGTRPALNKCFEAGK